MQPHLDASQPDDELAAAIIAVELYLAAERSVTPVEQPLASGWRVSAKLATQGVRPFKLGIAPRWNTIERVRRTTHGFEGVPGL